MDNSPSFELDEDIALNRGAAGRYEGAVSDRWNVGAGPNGGYLAALLLRGVLYEASLPDPLTMTVHYLARPAPGPCQVTVTTLREGRGHATYWAELAQEGAAKAAALVTLGRLRPGGPLDFQPEPPPLGDPEEAAVVHQVGEAPLWERIDSRVLRGEDIFFLRSEPGEAVTGGWTRLADGRPTDALAVAVFCDCWPPAVFGRTMRPDELGAPTIEYTVHWRNAPTSDWCYARFETRTFSGGYVDEHGELWDRAGRLVAESRQLARYGGGPAG